MSTNIHPTAIIDQKVEFGENVEIGPYCIIGPNVKLGNNVWLQSHVRIEKNTEIGDNCRIFHGASVGNDPQDLKYDGEDTWLYVGARTTMREFFTAHRGTSARGKTVIGSDCYFLNYVHIPHDAIIGDHVIMSNTVQIGGHSEVGDWVIIGGLAGIHQFCRIGCHAMVGFGFRVVQDVPPYVLAGGEPMEPMGVNRTGLQRRGFTNEKIEDIKTAYRILYRQNLTLAKAIEKIKTELPQSQEIKTFVSFIEKSERGIIR